jgi:farnesyl diphosphate synthase
LFRPSGRSRGSPRARHGGLRDVSGGSSPREDEAVPGRAHHREFEALLQSDRLRVEAALAARLDAAGPGRLRDALRHAALAPGKRLRPLLAIASFRACAGRGGKTILGPAAALELIHAYSLVHDDLPDFDDDALRRGRPTCHVVFGVPLALAAGFALLVEGLSWLAEAPAPVGRRLVRGVSRAIGLEGMAGGQYLDLLAEGRRPSPRELRAIHAGKTGRLIRESVLVGATLAGAPREVRAALARYGSHLGLAFQIADDLLDAEGDPRLTGKAAGTDAAAGKATFVSLYGPDGARNRARAAADEAKTAARAAGVDARLLLALADFVADRRR